MIFAEVYVFPVPGGPCIVRYELFKFLKKQRDNNVHFSDIKKLLKSFNSLIENGHSLIVVEHNIDLIKSSDYIIDLGLDGGYNGGQVIFQGTPENLVKENKSRLSDFLKEKLTI